MNTIFKSAVSRIKAKATMKAKTKEYLMENLTAASSSDPGKEKRKRPLTKRAVAAICTAVVVCAALVGTYGYYKTPVSYLSLDINPSVELGVNPFGKVVSAVAYNNDGKTILNGQDVINSSVKDAVDELVKSAAQKGFIAKDGSTVIALTSETDSNAVATQLQNDATQGAESAVEAEGDTATVQKENVALARRDEARKLGITPGKLNLIQKLQALDSTISVDEYKDAKVTDIMKKFVELKKQSLTNQGSSSSSSADESSESASSQTVSSESENVASTQPHTQQKGKSGKNAASSSETSSSEASSSEAGSSEVSSSSSSVSSSQASKSGKSADNSKKQPSKNTSNTKHG